MRKEYVLFLTMVMLTYGITAQATVIMGWVTVGNAGNANDDTGYGGVSDVYQIGKNEVTNSQYCEFLNVVDPTGANIRDLYSTSMGSGWNDIGGISVDLDAAIGSKYSVRTNRGDRPVNYVSWYDTLRFTNWLHNDQGTGDTEDGVYDMSLGSSVVRKAGATVWLPSEDEWYKAAYYKGGGTNAGYWDYPTRSDTAPTAEPPPGMDMVNGSANYYDGGYVDSTYYTTEVNAYTAKPSDSAYGTFDQGGNIFELNETLFDSSSCVFRGGSYVNDVSHLRSSFRGYVILDDEDSHIGFRVASPEPSTLLLLGLGAVMLRRKHRG